MSKKSIASLTTLLCMTLATGCANFGKQELPDYKKKTYSLSDIAAEYVPRVSENHFDRRPDHRAFEHIINLIDSYSIVHEPTGKEKVALDRMLAGSWSSIYHFDLGEVYHGLDVAIEVLEDVLDDKQNRKVLSDKEERIIKEDIKTFEVTRDYIDSLSGKSGLPKYEAIAQRFDQRMRKERERWTKDGEYNTIGYADEMAAIDVNVVLRSAQLHMVNFDNHMDAIQLCDLVKEGNERSYLYPKTLLLQAEAYGNLNTKLKANPINVMEEMQQRGFVDYLIEGIKDTVDSSGTNYDRLCRQIDVLKQDPITPEGQYNEMKYNVIQNILETRQQRNLEYTIDFFGLSPQANIAKARLSELEAIRKKNDILTRKKISY